MTAKTDRAKLRIARKTLEKWRRILHLDPIWTITFELTDAEIMEGALARVDTSNSEYYVAVMEVTSALLQLDDEEFEPIINEIICHELVHLVMVDFVRCAQLAAGNNESMHGELRYKYEQFTSRFQRAFMDLDGQITNSRKACTTPPSSLAADTDNKETKE